MEHKLKQWREEKVLDDLFVTLRLKTGNDLQMGEKTRGKMLKERPLPLQQRSLNIPERMDSIEPQTKKRKYIAESARLKTVNESKNITANRFPVPKPALPSQRAAQKLKLPSEAPVDPTKPKAAHNDVRNPFLTALPSRSEHGNSKPRLFSSFYETRSQHASTIKNRQFQLPISTPPNRSVPSPSPNDLEKMLPPPFNRPSPFRDPDTLYKQSEQYIQNTEQLQKLQNDVYDRDLTIAELSSRLSECTARLASLNQQHEQTNRKEEEVEDRHKLLDRQNHELNERLTSLTTSLNDKTLALNALRQEYRDLLARNKKLQSEHEEDQQRLQGLNGMLAEINRDKVPQEWYTTAVADSQALRQELEESNKLLLESRQCIEEVMGSTDAARVDGMLSSISEQEAMIEKLHQECASLMHAKSKLKQTEYELNECKSALDDTLAENAKLRQLLGNPRSRETKSTDAKFVQTDLPMDKLMARYENAIKQYKLMRAANNVMHQQMLENRSNYNLELASIKQRFAYSAMQFEGVIAKEINSRSHAESLLAQSKQKTQQMEALLTQERDAIATLSAKIQALESEREEFLYKVYELYHNAESYDTESDRDESIPSADASANDAAYDEIENALDIVERDLWPSSTSSHSGQHLSNGSDIWQDPEDDMEESVSA
ncbi:hypothetical protein BZG36_00221 [Bifiguratus adelaidae]|uniref:Uncharacterized protein n=1 Tax=Bifiguratus adelaidae TaxID=1938954 RepID=A0A261Y8X3_9FUNG|nr:hypothetical protein BZG36_00221 [Bifiguratus adelaidae]